MEISSEVLNKIIKELNLSSEKIVQLNVHDLENKLKLLINSSISTAQLFDSKYLKNVEKHTYLTFLKTAFQYSFMIEWILEGDLQFFKNMIVSIYSKCSIPEFTNRDDMGFDVKDFKDVPRLSSLGMKIFTKLLNYINIHENESKNKILYQIKLHSVVLSLEHLESHPWTNEHSRKQSEILTQVLFKTNSTLKEFLLAPNPNLYDKHCFEDLLLLIQPKLSKQTWKWNPSCPYIFKHLVTNIKFPNMSDCLNYVLPPTLLFLDDFQDDHKIIGFECLSHILNDTTKAEMKWCGRINVIYECCNKHFYCQNEHVVRVFMPCIFQVLSVIEKPLTNLDYIDQDTHHDKSFYLFIRQMELENKLILQKIYSGYLIEFIKIMNLHCLKHFTILFSVMKSYLNYPNGIDQECRKNILESLCLLIQIIWPRISHHVCEILECLLKLLYDISYQNKGINTKSDFELLKHIKKCIDVLDKLAPGHVHIALRSLIDLNLSSNVKDNINFLLDT